MIFLSLTHLLSEMSAMASAYSWDSASLSSFSYIGSDSMLDAPDPDLDSDTDAMGMATGADFYSEHSSLSKTSSSYCYEVVLGASGSYFSWCLRLHLFLICLPEPPTSNIRCKEMLPRLIAM